MNLHAMVAGAIGVVNPFVPAILYISTGNTTVNFKQVPTYDQSPISAQVQPLTSGDINHLDALNIQGAQKAIWINGTALAIDRIKNRGGDLIVFADGTLPEGNVWLVKASLEQWGGATWCRVAVALQDDPNTPVPPPMNFSVPGNVAAAAAIP